MLNAVCISTLVGHRLFFETKTWWLGAPPEAANRFPFWMQHLRGEYDGKEWVVAATVTAAVVLAVALVAQWPFLAKRFGSHMGMALGLGSASMLLGETQFPTSTASASLGAFFLSAISLWVIARLVHKPVFFFGSMLTVSGALATYCLVVFDVSPMDYNFLQASGLKLLQREPIGSFHMQYSLLSGLLFAFATRLGLTLSGQVTLVGIVNIALGVGYGALVFRLCRHPLVRLIACFSALLFRVQMPDGHLLAYPQTSLLRVDLWILPALAAAWWGPLSRRTMACVGLLSVLDNSLGLIFSSFYLLAAGLEYLTLSASERLLHRKNHLLAAGTFGVLFVWGLWLYGGLGSQSMFQYRLTQLGMLPIAPTSFFWLALVPFGLASGVIVSRRRVLHNRGALTIPFLAIGSLFYFFGRSHENNVLMASAPGLLVLFIAIEHLFEVEHTTLGNALCLALPSLMIAWSGGKLTEELNGMAQQYRLGQLVFQHPVESTIDAYRVALQNFPKEHTIIIDGVDAYLNARLGFRQTGYFSPYWSHFDREEEAEFLVTALGTGKRVVVTDRTAQVISDVAQAAFMATHNMAFELKPIQAGLVSEVVLRK